MVGKSVRPNADGIAVAAPSGVRRRPPRPRLRKRSLRHRTRRAPVRRREARVSAQPTKPNFSAAIVPVAKSTSRRPDAVPASGFAARPAVRRCVASSSGNGGGGSAPIGRGGDVAQRQRAGRELVDRYRHRPHPGIDFHCPQKEEGAGGFRDHSGPPAPFLRSSHRRPGDDSVPRRSGRSRAPRRTG